ncbi:MAG: hypothetical protein JWN70_1023, partial [Planctomycetaceae bacterium]|nr:hypothetical protein [Planctomycetaceae bacterium]
GDVNSCPGDVLSAQLGKTIGSTTDQVLYRFTVSGLNATLDRDSHGNLITAPISASPNAANPLLFSVNQFNTQAGAVNRVGQLRIAENVSPMPRDRIFFNYSYFQDAQFSQVLQSDVHRFTPGFEKTFMDGNASIEFRAPFATSIDPVVNLSNGSTNSGNVSWGNVNLTAKFLIYRSSSFAISTGLQVVAPTARDTILKSDVTGDVVDGRISNGATHILPFSGWLYTPNDRFFSQGFLQVDTDANGNGIYANNYLIDPSLAPMGSPKRIGTLYDTTNLYTSTSAGYWVYRSDSPDTLVQAWAPVMELHTSNSLEKADFVQRGQFQAGSPNRHVETINMVLGVHTQLRDRRFISAAYAFPVSGQADRQFQGEFRLLLNQLFGPINRQTAAGFFGG